MPDTIRDMKDTAASLADALMAPVAAGFSRTTILMVAHSARARLWENSESVRVLSVVEAEAFAEAINALDRLGYVLRANISPPSEGQGR